MFISLGIAAHDGGYWWILFGFAYFLYLVRKCWLLVICLSVISVIHRSRTERLSFTLLFNFFQHSQSAYTSCHRNYSTFFLYMLFVCNRSGIKTLLFSSACTIYACSLAAHLPTYFSHLLVFQSPRWLPCSCRERIITCETSCRHRR